MIRIIKLFCCVFLITKCHSQNTLILDNDACAKGNLKERFSYEERIIVSHLEIKCSEEIHELVLQDFPNLESLYLQFPNANEYAPDIAALLKLKAVVIDSKSVLDSIPEGFSLLTNLKLISFNFALSEWNFEVLMSINSLEEIQCPKEIMNDIRLIKRLPKFPNLRVLSLEPNPPELIEFYRVSDQLKNLESLTLYSKQLIYLDSVKCPNIMELNVGRISTLTTGALNYSAKLRKLSINSSRCKRSNCNFDFIYCFPNLEYILFYNMDNNILDLDCKKVPNLTRIEYIVPHGFFFKRKLPSKLCNVLLIQKRAHRSGDAIRS
jgi:hypothetical protein